MREAACSNFSKEETLAPPPKIPGHHRTTKRLFESVHQFVLRLNGEIQAAIPFGEAFRFECTLLPQP